MTMADAPSLMIVFSGWDGYNTSLIRAVASLTPEQLAFRLTPDMRSVGELAAHIAFGRLDWFHRMAAPGSQELVAEAAPYWQPWGQVNPIVENDVTEIVRWLEASWRMIETCLNGWEVANLSETYLQPYGGKTYSVSRQWVIWRIMAHDIHHGGQLTIMLGAQGIYPPDLSGNGGHIIEVPLAEPL